MTTAVERQTMVIPANCVRGPKQGDWTYNHYAALPDDGQRYEIVAGVLYISPSLNNAHQDAVLWIAHYLQIHVRITRLGRVYMAPFDVELLPKFVVQPDVIVLLNSSLEKLTSSRIIGAPDLVVEVSSPSTMGYDHREKQDAYACAGVPEYWIAAPTSRTMEVLILEGKQYQSLGIFSGQATLRSKVVPSIAEIPVEQFFG